MFLIAPSSSTTVVSSGFCRMFPGFHPCFYMQGFLSSFVFLHGFVPLSLLGGVVHSIFSAFSFRLAVLDYLLFLTFLSFANFPYSSVGFFAVSFLSSGFLPFGYLSPSSYVSPRLVPLSFVLAVLVPALSFGSSSHFCVLTVLPVSALGLSFAS